ncbi:hypothetical protein D3C81_504370 [compost metagenome]
MLYTFVLAHRQHLQEGFGQVHLRVLQRSTAQVRPILAQAGLVQAVVAGEVFGDDIQRRVYRGFHQVLAHLAPVMGAGEDDERMGVEVLAPVQRLAVGVDAVEPAAVLGVVEVPLQ